MAFVPLNGTFNDASDNRSHRVRVVLNGSVWAASKLLGLDSDFIRLQTPYEYREIV